MDKNSFRFQMMTEKCRLQGKGLEIGPSYDPICPKKDGYDVEIIDCCSKEELLEKYKNDLTDWQLSNIEDVDYIWSGQSYAELTGRKEYYDYVIASNLIEHVTDIIGFLQDCAVMLKPNGILSLAVPDKRFCFDYYRPLTSIQKVIDRHLTSPEKHSKGAIAEYCLNAVRSQDGISWSAQSPLNQKSFSSVCSEGQVLEAINNNRLGEYMDIHDWVFTPSSFRLLIKDLYSLGYSDFTECDFCPTPSDRYEFYIILRKNTDLPRTIDHSERMALLAQTDVELKTITAGMPDSFQRFPQVQVPSATEDKSAPLPAETDMGVGAYGREKPEKIRRMLLFHLYSASRTVERYVIHLLSELRKYCEYVVVISNGGLRANEKEKLTPLADVIICRENVGYDFGGWQDAILNHIGFKRLAEYDEVLFCNDSVYGPIFTLDPVFREMEERPVDFWGITGMTEWNGFVGIKSDETHSSHIQSYFFAIRRHMLGSSAFRKFWTDLSVPDNHAEAVFACEIKMTETFFSAGFDWDVYVDMHAFNDTPDRAYIPYICQHRKLIEEYGMPFVKRNILSLPKTQILEICYGNDAGAVLSYVKEKTDYDVDMIWEDCLRNRPIRSLFESLHLNYVLNESMVTTEPQEPPSQSVALFLHSYFEDLIPYCVKYALSMPDDADIIVTTDSERKRKLIQDAFSAAGRNVREIRIVKNRGRELKAFLVDCADLIPQYDCLCFIHDKKSTQDLRPVGESFQDILFENLLCSPEYVRNILNTFALEPRLGMLGAPRPILDGYAESLGIEWLSEFHATEKLLRQAGVTVPIAWESAPFLLGSCFWCRGKVLSKLLALELNECDFMPEPLPICNTLNHALERSFEFFSADSGYYVGLVMTTHYASLNLSNLLYIAEHPAYFPLQIPRQVSAPEPATSSAETKKIVPVPYIRIPMSLYLLFHKIAPKGLRNRLWKKYFLKEGDI